MTFRFKLNNHVPGETVTLREAAEGTLSIYAKVMRFGIRQIRVYSGAALIHCVSGEDAGSVSLTVPLKGLPLEKYIRVEIEGINKHWICNSSPFYLS